MHILQTCPHWLVADSHPPWKSPLGSFHACALQRGFHFDNPTDAESNPRVWTIIVYLGAMIHSHDSHGFGMFGSMHPVFEQLFSNRNTVYRSSECQPATSKNDKPAITRSFQIRNIPAFCPQVFEWRWQCWWICRRPSGFCSDRWCPQIFPLCVICRHWGQTMRKTSYPPCKLFDVQLPLKTKGRNLKNGTSGKRNSKLLGSIFHFAGLRSMIRA